MCGKDAHNNSLIAFGNYCCVGRGSACRVFATSTTFTTDYEAAKDLEPHPRRVANVLFFLQYVVKLVEGRYNGINYIVYLLGHRV